MSVKDMTARRHHHGQDPVPHLWAESEEESMNYKLGSLFDGSIEWRPIKGYENEYLVSEAGDVWSVRSERKLSLKRERTGYLRVNLSVDGVSKAFSVHR